MSKVTIGLAGGLGNQMFQYAIGKQISLMHNKQLFLDLDPIYYYVGKHDLIYYQLHHFALEVEFATAKDRPWYKILWKRPRLDKIWYIIEWILKKGDRNYVIQNPKHPFIHAAMYDFDPRALQYRKGNVYYEGFRQDEKYFADIKETIRKDFVLKSPITDPQNTAIVTKMQESNAIGLHVRRNDYIGTSLGGVTNKEYYINAIRYIEGHVENPTFFVFSDDISRCKENLPHGYSYHFIDWNTKENSYKDIRLMSQCKHNIIANSTFSRRGAWLNNNPNKIIIAPKKRHQTINFDGIIPPNRIRL